MAKWLIILGVLLVVVGAVLHFFPRIPLGRLPGDIVWRRDGLTVYFPWVTCLVLSILLSLLLHWLNK